MTAGFDAGDQPDTGAVERAAAVLHRGAHQGIWCAGCWALDKAREHAYALAAAGLLAQPADQPDTGAVERAAEVLAKHAGDNLAEPVMGLVYRSRAKALAAAGLLAQPAGGRTEDAAWPCDDYKAPLTCYTVPNGPKHLTCGGCREAFPNGPEVQALYRASGTTDGGGDGDDPAWVKRSRCPECRLVNYFHQDWCSRRSSSPRPPEPGSPS